MNISPNARAIYGSVAKARGIALAQEVETTILTQLEAAIRYENGRPFLVDQNGNRASTANITGKVVDVSFEEFVIELIKAIPTTETPANTSKTTPEKPTGKPLNLTVRMQEMLAERKSKEAQLATDIRGNPWSRETLNLTHQMLIARADPARAERLKAQAKGNTP